MTSAQEPTDRSAATGPSDPADASGPRVTDKRRVDPETGEVRTPTTDEEQVLEREADLLEAELSDLEAGLAEDLVTLRGDLAERTADLQRLHAEYANYRKRVERDRETVREQAAAKVLTDLLPVLDDIGRAREHGELEGAFKAVGEALESTLLRLGLEPFGAEGDPFDPTVHEAFTHEHSADVTESTCVRIFQPGYRYAGRVVRPARVAVADPE